jgi:D-sedoheptulose 7-phosphate isomerase
MASPVSDDLIQERIAEAVEVTRSLSEPRRRETLLAIVRAMCDSLQQGGKVLFCGNGGSAADAQHLAAELVGRYLLDRRPLPAICLTDNTATLTAVANDYGYGDVLARAVSGLGVRGDVLVGLTTSGTSANVLAALAAGRAAGLTTVAFVGRNTAEVSVVADHVISIDSPTTAHVQEAHMVLGHIVCELVEQTVCG